VTGSAHQSDASLTVVAFFISKWPLDLVGLAQAAIYFVANCDLKRTRGGVRQRRQVGTPGPHDCKRGSFESSSVVTNNY